MRAKFTESAGFALTLLGFLGGILYLTISLNRVARLVPLAVVVPAIVFVSIEVLLELAPGLAKRNRFLEQKDVFRVEQFRGSVHAETSSKIQARSAGREASVFAWVGAIPALIYIFGFLMAVPLFLFLYLRWRSKEGWLLSITTAATSVALLYFLFIEMMRVPLYEGRFWIWLLR